jgi:hypothetical protein
VATVTSTVPAAWAGETATICVAEMTLKEAAARVPNDTPVAALKFVPVIETTVPPAVLPDVVARLVTVGADAAVKV